MNKETGFNAECISIVKALKEKSVNEANHFSAFELDFINTSALRVEKFGDTTFFSEKQSALANKINKERIIDNKKYFKKGETA